MNRYRKTRRYQATEKTLLMVLSLYLTMVFSFAIYQSLGLIEIERVKEERKEKIISRGWHGHRLTTDEIELNKEYINADIRPLR